MLFPYLILSQVLVLRLTDTYPASVRELSGKRFCIKQEEVYSTFWQIEFFSSPVLCSLHGPILQDNQQIFSFHFFCAGGLCPGQSALTPREELRMFGQSSGPPGQRATSIELKNGMISLTADGKLLVYNGREVEVWYWTVGPCSWCPRHALGLADEMFS